MDGIFGFFQLIFWIIVVSAIISIISGIIIAIVSLRPKRNATKRKASPQTSVPTSPEIKTRLDIEELHAPEEFLETWPPNIHCTEEQEIRYKRSEYIWANNLFDVKRTAGTALCHSSTHYSEIYKVSYFSCTCRDFNYRYLPCKHMYALARATRAMPATFDFSGVPEEIKNRISCLEEKGLRQFVKILKEHKPFERFILKKTPSVMQLLDNCLLTDMGDSYLILEDQYTKNDLIAEIYQSNIAYRPKKSETKQEIISHLMANEREFASKLYGKYVYSTYSSLVRENYKSIYKKYCK